VLKGGSALGLTYVLFIIALISLTLAIMNVLPVPALDGGRLYLMLISRLTKEKRLTPKMEETIVGASFMLLLGLIILITIVDVKRFF
jgi:regulator of sigma E protease